MANGVRREGRTVAPKKKVASVWTRREAEPEQPALSRAAIVREAIVMLDAEGAEALSMRKLGAQLNAGATSLYRHVATKDELIELAVDEVFGEVTVPPAGADWRAEATAAAGSFRATALHHPWLGSVLGQAGMAQLGPNLGAFSHGLVGLFTAAGYPEPTGALDTLLSYVIGMSTTEAAWLTTVARSGLTEVELVTQLSGQELGELDPAQVRESKFAYGLEVVLDGLATRIT